MNSTYLMPNCPRVTFVKLCSDRDSTHISHFMLMTRQQWTASLCENTAVEEICSSHTNTPLLSYLLFRSAYLYRDKRVNQDFPYAKAYL